MAVIQLQLPLESTSSAAAMQAAIMGGFHSAGVGCWNVMHRVYIGLMRRVALL